MAWPDRSMGWEISISQPTVEGSLANLHGFYSNQKQQISKNRSFSSHSFLKSESPATCQCVIIMTDSLQKSNCRVATLFRKYFLTHSESIHSEPSFGWAWWVNETAHIMHLRKNKALNCSVAIKPLLTTWWFQVVSSSLPSFWGWWNDYRDRLGWGKVLFA